MTTQIGTRGQTFLTDDMLARFDERAPRYDRDNAFFVEDFDELRASGYLTAPIPEEFGGGGRLLDEMSALTRRLAYVAPATALACNMHLYWMGVAADVHRSGDSSCDWMLDRGVAGDIFAAGHGEAGNDLPLMLSSASATKVSGGWEISGHKIFGTLSPVWTWLGLHAMETSDAGNRRIVHGFLHRSAPGYQIVDTWDTLGMRATQSQDTVLDGAFVADDRTPVVCPSGFAGAGLFHLSIFAWGLLGLASVYAGLARRAYDEMLTRIPQRTSVALSRSMAYHPEVQHKVAEMRMALETIDWTLERVTADWAAGADYPDWAIKLLTAKKFCVDQAFRVVDNALDLSGGAGIFKRNRIEQLFRDARLGRVHPANDMLAYELVGKLALGLDPDDPQRWG